MSPRASAAAGGTDLDRQLAALAASDPVRRIDLREPILAHGLAAVAPLAALVEREPDLGPAVTAWLEVLGRRDEAALAPVATALRGLLASSRDDTCRHAAEALARLGIPVTAAQARRAAAARGG